LRLVYGGCYTEIKIIRVADATLFVRGPPQMRVASDEFDLLVRFLNHDFKVLNQSTVKIGTPLYFLIDDIGLERADFIEGISQTKLGEAQKLQTEIRTDLSGLVDKQFTIQPWRHLYNLIDKINGLGLEPHWKLEFGDEKLLEVGVRLTPKGARVNFPVRTEKMVSNPAHRHLGPDQKILDVQKSKWIIRRFYPETAPVRNRLYWTVITQLENGGLGRLRRCSNCSTFFIAARHKAKRFCLDRCRTEFNNKQRSGSDFYRKWRKRRRNQQDALRRKKKGS
jgi:hypothetical protein